MAGNFTEQAQWTENVPKISNGEAIDENLLNQAPQVLANRTRYLKQHRHDGVVVPIDYAADTGTVNAYVVAFTPALTAHVTGLPLQFKALNTNTGASTLAVNGMPAVNITLADGSALNHGNIRAGGVYTVIYGGSSYLLLNPSERTGLVRMEYYVPSGYLALDGSLVSRTTYAALYSFAYTQGLIVTESDWSSSKSGLFGEGNGSTTFRLPDFRGEFVRALDNGRGVDSGRTLGSRQADAYKSHSHSTGETLITWGAGGAYVSPLVEGSNGANTSASGGTETRPRNVALIPVVKW